MIHAGSRWRHHKGGEYIVLVVARMEDDGQEVVVYRSLVTGKAWVRPLEHWQENVWDTASGRFVGARFVLVEPQNVALAAPEPTTARKWEFSR